MQEVKPNLVEEIKPLTAPLEEAVEGLQDGDILVFQQNEVDLSDRYHFATAWSYFRQVLMILLPFLHACCLLYALR